MISQNTLLKQTNFSRVSLEFKRGLPTNSETEYLRMYINQVILQNYPDMMKIGTILEEASDILEKGIADNISSAIPNLTDKSFPVENEALFKRAIEGLLYQENPLSALYRASVILYNLSLMFTKN